MGVSAILAAVWGLVVTVAFVGIAWMRSRSPSYRDDPSVFLGDPPPETTAATAVIVDDGPTEVAFMAALLDLASRDEIRFHDEGLTDGRGAVGIEIRGGDSSDARVLLNRRRPIGEPEAFLLTQLKEAPLMAHLATDPLAPLAQAMEGLLQYSAFVNSPETAADSPAERARRSHGLFAGQSADPADIVAGLETRLGHPLPGVVRDRYLAIGALSEALGHPASEGHPDAQLPDPLGAAPEGDPRADLPTSPGPAVDAAPSGAGVPAGSTPTYISAAQALHLRAPLLFRTVAETYARRQGWISGLSLVCRWRWRAVAILELGLAALAFQVGSGSLRTVLGGLALGIATGAVITLLLAPLMPGSTRAGALIRAQLAAYRRTLRATLQQAQSLADVGAGSGLAWLETPDQAIVWAVALELRPELEAFLARATGRSPGPPGSTQTDLPWYRGADPGRAGQTLGARAMFAGIAAIGSQPKSLTTSVS